MLFSELLWYISWTWLQNCVDFKTPSSWFSQNHGCYVMHKRTSHEVCYCESCGKEFVRNQSASAFRRLRRHLKVCKNPRPYECSGDGCIEAFASKRTQKAHIANCKLVTWRCQHCLATFESGRSLGRHRNSCPHFVLLVGPNSEVWKICRLRVCEIFSNLPQISSPYTVHSYVVTLPRWP